MSAAAATTASARKNSIRALHLYRALLRAHNQHLPTPEMKELGNAYVKNEFQLHKSTTNETQLAQFFTEWDHYLQQLRQTARARDIMSLDSGAAEMRNGGIAAAVGRFGRDLPHDVQLTQEQQAQLEQLRNETAGKGDGT